MEAREAGGIGIRPPATSVAPGGQVADVPEAFRTENRRLLLSRTRIFILIACGLLLASVPVDYFRVPPDLYPRALALRLAGCAVLVALLPVLSWTGAERRAEWLAGAVFLILATITISMAPLFAKGATDPNYAIQIIGTVFLVMGAGLVLPFQGRTMALLGGILLLVHVGVTMDFALAQNVPALFATFAAVVVATVGAHQLFEGRRSEYRARLAQERLLVAKEETVRAQEELLRARADFVAMLTHDIKNPLASVLGFTAILREQLRDGDDTTEAVDCIESGTQQAMALAINFLEVDRIKRGALALHRKPTSLNRIVESGIGSQGPFSRLKRVALRADLCAESPLPELDEGLVDRVLANLLGNAIKFSPGGTEVVVTTGLRDRHAVVEVRDGGPGIAPEDRAKLFHRYSRLAGPSTDSTGLGLFIVRTIVEAHGGRVGVECPPEGGSIFEVSFPLDQAALPR